MRQLQLSDKELIYQYKDLGISLNVLENKYHTDHRIISKRLNELGCHVRNKAEARYVPLIITDEKLVHMYKDLGKSAREISREVGRGHHIIIKRLQNLGYEIRLSKVLSLSDEEIVNIYINNGTIASLARECKCDTHKIKKILQSNNCHIRSIKETQNLDNIKSIHRKNHRKLILNDEDILNRYNVLHFSANKIARECNCGSNLIKARLIKLGCVIRGMEGYWSNLSTLERAEQIRKSLSAACIRPNKLELLVGHLLDELYPNQWKYVGNGEVIIGGLNPDFININGKKLIIEVFGEYFHSEKCEKNIKWNRTEEGRIQSYSNIGFKTLVVWERETTNIGMVKNKIMDFVNSSENNNDKQ